MSTTSLLPSDIAVKAAQLAATGMPLGQIATQLEISTEQARGMVQEGKRIKDARTPATAPAPAPAAAGRPMTDQELLAWARSVDSPARARTVGERIHIGLRELRQLKDAHDQTRDARERLAAANKAVAQAKAELRRLQTAAKPTAEPVPPPTTREENQVIRDWARVNGFPDIGVAGVISRTVRHAYERRPGA
jgi:pyruvate/2-oxoglutarate dehydrogenase complex dihydrolipoamide acyltransferase (E2) component